MKLDVAGCWIGRYEFGDLYPPDLAPVRFQIDVRAGWFGRFRGVVQDDPVTGMPEPGIVRGRVSGLRIVFTKLMPVAYVLTESGSIVSTREYVRESSGRDPGEIRHAALKYSGTFDPQLARFRGEWRFDDPGHQGCGTWWMAKTPES